MAFDRYILRPRQGAESNTIYQIISQKNMSRKANLIFIRFPKTAE